MKVIIQLLPVLLYVIIGIISLVMAFKNLFAHKFLPFHEKASGKQWNDIDELLKPVIISLLRLAGLGFLIVAVLMLIFPLVNYFHPDEFLKYSIPVMALIFCSGLFFINYTLYRRTKVKTPCKGSLYAILIIILGIVISVLN